MGTRSSLYGFGARFPMILFCFALLVFNVQAKTAFNWYEADDDVDSGAINTDSCGAEDWRQLQQEIV